MVDERGADVAGAPPKDDVPNASHVHPAVQLSIDKLQTTTNSLMEKLDICLPFSDALKKKSKVKSGMHDNSCKKERNNKNGGNFIF